MLIRTTLDISHFWKESNYTLNISSWISLGNTLKYLPFFLTWHIWLTRNKCIFEDKKPDVSYAVLSIKNYLQLYPVIAQQKKLRRNIGPTPILNFLAGFFDGSSAKHMGAVGVHLFLSQDHYYCLKLGVGLSTNTISELLDLWTLLHCAKIMGLPHLHIHGDSAVIINWFNH